jgi:hypothetical protein
VLVLYLSLCVDPIVYIFYASPISDPISRFFVSMPVCRSYIPTVCSCLCVLYLSVRPCPKYPCLQILHLSLCAGPISVPVRRSCCDKLGHVADRVIQEMVDPLILQPASLDVATIRKRTEEEIGQCQGSNYCSQNRIPL